LAGKLIRLLKDVCRDYFEQRDIRHFAVEYTAVCS